MDKELADGVHPTRIGYFSFTRKAANEARDRAVQKFPKLNAKTDFPYFRTLHSLAFHVLGTRTEDIMQPENYNEFAKQAGIELNLTSDEEEAIVKADHPILNEINLARIRGVDLREHYNQSGLDIEWHHFEFVERTYRHYKHSHYLLDFTDLLELAVLESHRLPELDVLIIDEAQDLSRLQWNLVEALCLKSRRVYLAGDDDQAVFTWAGADVNSFLAFEGTIKILEQSFRVPSSVHRLADEIVHRIRTRQEKIWKPRDFEGDVITYSKFEHCHLDDGQWLILASTNYLLNPIGEWLKSQGVLFERSGVPSIGPTVIKAVTSWERLRKGQDVPGEDVRHIYRYLDGPLVARGHKTFKGEPTHFYTLEQLIADHGLLTSPIWHEALTKIADDKREYLISVLRRGGKLSDTFRVKLSTIHGAKGGEADNVMLLMDLSPKFARDMQSNGDNLNRLFYVGVTRTKQTLHLILPKNQNQGFRL